MDFIYLSQVTQAICIDAEAQHYRRLLSTDGIFTRGTLYWQLVWLFYCYDLSPCVVAIFIPYYITTLTTE